MISVEIPITTTYATTEYIPIPSGYPDIDSIPTTQYLQGSDGLVAVNVKDYTTSSVQINHTAVKHNILKLHYEEVGLLTRYVGISERP